MDEHFDPELDFDWGGDGTDLNEPVAEHALAAVVPQDGGYPAPLERFFDLGDARELRDLGPHLTEWGIRQEHVPDLVRMMRDRALWTVGEGDDRGWAPIHALHALQHLDVSAVVEDLIPLFDVDSDWFGEDLPEVIANAGLAAIEPLTRYVRDRSRWVWGRVHAASAIGLSGQRHPELRDRAIQILLAELERAAENDPTLTTFLITDLAELKAVEALPAVRRAFEMDVVDEMVMGDWERVQQEFGQDPDPADPLIARSRAHAIASQVMMRASFAERPLSGLTSPTSPYAPAPQKKNEHAKVKNKRKMAKASRKANKSKKKKR